MEQALKPKYNTRELKKDIIENAETILENRERIKKVEASVSCIDAHITRHKDVIDPMVTKHNIVLFGPNGDDGLAHRMNNVSDSLEKIEAGINKVLWTVILAVVGALLKLVVFP